MWILFIRLFSKSHDNNNNCAPISNWLAAPECSSYTLLTEADRSVSFKGGAKCDSGLSTKWYRFSAAAGAAMPESCVPKNQCGTHAPGWLNGKNPTVAEGVVSRQVCYHWSSNCCLWKNNIRVRNCGGFYVYELRKPPACQLRYCGGPAIAGSLFLFQRARSWDTWFWIGQKKGIVMYTEMTQWGNSCFSFKFFSFIWSISRFSMYKMKYFVCFLYLTLPNIDHPILVTKTVTLNIARYTSSPVGICRSLCKETLQEWCQVFNTGKELQVFMSPGIQWQKLWTRYTLTCVMMQWLNWKHVISVHREQFIFFFPCNRILVWSW